MQDSTTNSWEPILAAGGILRGTGKNTGRIAIIRRHRYGGEVSLPKGKLHAGEGNTAAALREVREETGYTAHIQEFAGTTHYIVGGVPKVVSYFVMDVVGEQDEASLDRAEVETVAWMTPQEAVAALSHRQDRDLVAAVFEAREERAAYPTAANRSARRLTWRRPDLDRLAGNIADTWVALDHQIQAAGADALTAAWARTARRHLLRAEGYLEARDLHLGWGALTQAQRMMLEDPSDPEKIRRVAVMLHREVDKITGWRAKAIQDLIGGSKGELLAEVTPKRVIDAVALRDDQFQTTYFKVLLRRRHLLRSFWFLLFGLTACWAMSQLDLLPKPFTAEKVPGIILFGALGAGLSVSLGLLAAAITDKIPEQHVGAFVVWMRPLIGAVAALAAVAILDANNVLHIFSFSASDPAAVNVIAFAAGFSERFITRAIEGIPLGGGKKES
jgi:8-oxo-dGTP diphosphatase